MIGRFAAALLALCLAPAAAAAQTRAGDPPLLVFAAASLNNALDEVVRAYPGPRPVPSYAASSVLARQIERGAPASIYLSANKQWMDYLERHGLLVPGTRRDLLGNRLVLIAPAATARPVRIAPGMPLARWLGPQGRLALGDPHHVPAGIYAKAALESLGVWDSVRGRIAAAANVRAALALVARGEAPLGIVYATDAMAEPAVRVVGRFDPSLHPPIVYPLALVKGAAPGAHAFAEYLEGPAARRIFEKYGFTPLN